MLEKDLNSETPKRHKAGKPATDIKNDLEEGYSKVQICIDQYLEDNGIDDREWRVSVIEGGHLEKLLLTSTLKEINESLEALGIAVLTIFQLARFVEKNNNKWHVTDYFKEMRRELKLPLKVALKEEAKKEEKRKKFSKKKLPPTQEAVTVVLDETNTAGEENSEYLTA